MTIAEQSFNAEPIINQWLTAKEKFIKRFKEEKEKQGLESYSDFIYEFPEPMTFSLDTPTKLNKIHSFIEFIEEYLYEYGEDDNVVSSFCKFLKLNVEGFFENKVVFAITYKGNEIKVGMNLLKAFKFFFSGSILEDLQSKASVLIQENKITGRLCISVHPLDYLSASETCYDWRSCHALDGDYRAGNLAYMVDNCTVMCYLRGDEEVRLPRFPRDVLWNSKKWRMLLFLTQGEQIVWAGRQYPYESSAILTTIEHKVVPIITGLDYVDKSTWFNAPNFSHWSDFSYSNDGTLYDSYVDFDGYLFPKRSLIHSTNNLFYNDLLFSTKYTPSYLWKRGMKNRLRLEDIPSRRSDLDKIHLRVGEDPICPCCGKYKVMFSDEMICPECDEDYGTQVNDEFTFCERCGDRIFKDNAICDDNDDYYCTDCWDSMHEEEW